MLFRNFCLLSVVALGSAAGSLKVESTAYNGNDPNSSPSELAESSDLVYNLTTQTVWSPVLGQWISQLEEHLDSPAPVGFPGLDVMDANFSPTPGSARPTFVERRSPHHQDGGESGSSHSGRPPKYKGSSGSYATHGNSHNDQTSAAIPSKKNPFSLLVRRSNRSTPVVILGSDVEAMNNHGETKSRILPEIVINATDDVSAAREKQQESMENGTKGKGKEADQVNEDVGTAMMHAEEYDLNEQASEPGLGHQSH
ncbi:MAG: hypothetical protein LQ352_002288 [Teloschistes flavicans]|nr:MAG: hypothetical protein LQ352_002288 [Teloschistes flavicans]